MPQSLSNILVHLIFSTKNREQMINPPVEDELWRYLAATCKACGCETLKVGGTHDHIHIACGLSRTISISDLLEEIKKRSSKWMKTKNLPGFGWQNGYGAFSIGQSQLPDLLKYIDIQKKHHQRRTFQDEYRDFLEKYGIKYDEQYVWD